jgi:hypothetical protein
MEFKSVTNDRAQIHWARVANGAFMYWNGTETIKFSKLTGKIIGVTFRMNTYNGTDYETALIMTDYQGERWVFSVRTDSQYFRSLVNYLMFADQEGKLFETLEFCPRTKTDQHGRTFNKLFVALKGGYFLKQWFTVGDPKNIPQAIKHDIGGKIVWIWTAQDEYLKNWLLDKFNGNVHGERQPAEQPPLEENPDDLPF